ncbi:MAG TPA: tripartite tricarboxylate transporter permease [Verrucomicrobiae bacterium]|jgi:putative tricarboxylic transport membrane protein|nr:tripartite tricarboxylate transporter permease [Verrucomicrobiae bacterium]
MLEAFISGFWQVLSWPAFGYLLVGIGIGFWVGLLPGIGGLATLALMLPFSYTIKTPIEAFCFLLGMLAVTGTTGDLTSILFGIPGESSSAALILDGYPMSKKGEAGRALGAAIMSSLLGATIGALSLAISIPIMRPLVLLFGSPELFIITLMGITFIGTLAGASLIKGLLAGGVGLMLASIGVDPQTGALRYTFGALYLWDGLDVTPVVVGMFAIPEIIDLAVRGTSISNAPKEKLKGVMEGVKDTFRHFWLVVRCSLIGVYFGVLPVLGANVAQWIAYGHAARGLKDKSRAGKGAVEGVLGPGAANNSTRGGDLIPTIAFGIPGSASMALLLGALLIVGLQPGPEMLKSRLDVTFAMVWILIISNIIVAGISFLILNHLAALTFIRGSLLIPFLLVLVFIGSFTANNSIYDLIVTVLFGTLGYCMLLNGWPRPPLVLGLILGKIGENYLWISTAAYGGKWLAFPSVLILIAITIAVVAYPTIKERRGRAKYDRPEDAV